MILAAMLAAAVGQFAPQAPPVAHYLPGGTTVYESPGGRYRVPSSVPAATPARWPLQYRTPVGLPLPLPPGYPAFSAAPPPPAPSRAREILASRAGG